MAKPRDYSIAIGAAIGITVAIAYVWLTQPRVKTFADSLREHESRDPRLGYQIQFDLPGASAGKPTMLIAAGNCNSCSISFTKIPPDIASRFNVVIASYAKTYKTEIVDNDIPYELVTEDELIHKTLNAYFTPRIGVLDASGKLVALQSREESVSDFCKRSEKR